MEVGMPNPRALVLVPTLIGLLFFFLGAFFLLDNLRFVSTAQPAQGRIEDWVVRRSSTGDHASTYYPRVRFQTPQGRPMEFVSNSGDNAMVHISHDVDVLYDPLDPSRARIDSIGNLWALPAIFTLLGALLALSPLWSSLYQARDRRKVEELKRIGDKLSLQVKTVEVNSNIKVGNRSPWVVVCDAPDSGPYRGIQFRSGNIWNDPAPHLHGEPLSVWVDPLEPRRYHVDTDFLP